MPFLLVLLYILGVCAAIAAPVAAARFVVNDLPPPAVKADPAKPAAKAASADAKNAASKATSAMAKEPPRHKKKTEHKRPQTVTHSR